jgi:hypothetical protein
MKNEIEDMFITDMVVGSVIVITSPKPRGEIVCQLIWNNVEAPTVKSTLTVGEMDYSETAVIEHFDESINFEA